LRDQLFIWATPAFKRSATVRHKCKKFENMHQIYHRYEPMLPSGAGLPLLTAAT
jgi:hypothetical protein